MVPARDLPMKPMVQTFGLCHVISNRPDVTPQLFEASNPALEAEPVGDGGRGAAWFVRFGGEDAVLREFRRGGLIARFNKTRYLWQGLGRTRSFHEFRVLSRLHAQGLSVAVPLAAIACRVGPFCYQAALVTRRIAGARPLCDLDEPRIWRKAGALIRAMHDLGVWHADLNVHNILVDARFRLWLIDFDRAKEGVHAPQRLAQNLARLERSVRKVCPQRLDGCWPVLRAGYDQGGL